LPKPETTLNLHRAAWQRRRFLQTIAKSRVPSSCIRIHGAGIFKPLVNDANNNLTKLHILQRLDDAPPRGDFTKSSSAGARRPVNPQWS
jgi:hypothetical protein